MKPRAIVLLSIVLLLVSITLFALNIHQKGVAESPPAGDKDVGQLSEEGIQAMEQTEKTGEEAKDQPEMTVNDLVSFIDKWKASILSEPGWLHIKAQVDQEGVDLGIFPDGSSIPEDYISEKWYLLDNRGLVIEAVSVMYDLNGQEIQSSVFENLTWTNLTYDLSFSGEYFYPNLDHELAKNIASGGFTRIEQGETFINGRPVIEVTTHEGFESPIDIEGFPLSITSIINRLIFDAESGALISSEMIMRLPDGQERTVGLKHVLAIEKVEAPPGSALSLFEEVSK